jgi:hypothetical protein
VVGLASLGGQAGIEQTGLERDPFAQASPASGTPAPTRTERASTIVIEHPHREGAIVRPTDLVVVGHLRDGAGPVRVIVETSRNKPLAMQEVEPTPGTGADAPRRFAATMAVGDRREGERLIIHVIAYDAAGVPVEVLRRRVVVGPDEPWIIGEDGLMGGIAFPSSGPSEPPSESPSAAP